MAEPSDLSDSERLVLLRDAIAELAPRLTGDLEVMMHAADPAARLAMARRVVQHAATLRSAAWNVLRVANAEVGRLDREVTS